MKLNATIRQIYVVFFTGIFLMISSAAAAQDSTSKKISGGNKKIFFGEASFYSDKFNGRQTSNGEIFSQKKMTCASNVVKMGTWVKVTNLRNNKSAIVKVNDRLHPSMRRVVDLTRAAAKQLAFTDAGLTRVKVEVLGKKKPE